MTDIVPVPSLTPSTEFPTNADRTAGTFNQKAYDWAQSARAMAEQERQIAEATHNNATAAKEQADRAEGEADRAVVEADRSRDEADAAEGFRDTAGEHATTATEQAGIAVEQAGIATTQAGIAGGHAGDALTQANRAEDEADRSFSEANRAQAAADSISDGPVTSVGGETGIVLLKTLNGSPLTGSGNIVIDSSLYRDARTTNTQLVAADKGKLIDITSGTFTQTFAAAATLGDGWYCYIKNSGTGNITIPASDSITNWIMYPGEMRMFQCDGAQFRSFVLHPRAPQTKIYTENTTWAKPAGLKAVKVIVTGKGAAGAGGTAIKWIDAASLAQTVAVTVSQGVAGASSFGSHLSATGPSVPSSLPGGTAAGGDINLGGGSANNVTGGSSYWGGGKASSEINKPPFGAGHLDAFNAANIAKAGDAVVVVQEIF